MSADQNQTSLNEKRIVHRPEFMRYDAIDARSAEGVMDERPWMPEYEGGGSVRVPRPCEYEKQFLGGFGQIFDDPQIILIINDMKEDIETQNGLGRR